MVLENNQDCSQPSTLLTHYTGTVTLCTFFHVHCLFVVCIIRYYIFTIIYTYTCILIVSSIAVESTTSIIWNTLSFVSQVFFWLWIHATKLVYNFYLLIPFRPETCSRLLIFWVSQKQWLIFWVSQKQWKTTSTFVALLVFVRANVANTSNYCRPRKNDSECQMNL